MCGAISTKCIVESCQEFVRYDTICNKCKNNKEYPAGV